MIKHFPPYIYNPLEKDMSELPTIWAFPNTVSDFGYYGNAVADDYTILNGHCSSDEYFLYNDLGVGNLTFGDGVRIKYNEHYPNGYILEYVTEYEIKNKNNEKFNIFLEKANAYYKELKNKNSEIA